MLRTLLYNMYCTVYNINIIFGPTIKKRVFNSVGEVWHCENNPLKLLRGERRRETSDQESYKNVKRDSQSRDVTWVEKGQSLESRHWVFIRHGCQKGTVYREISMGFIKRGNRKGDNLSTDVIGFYQTWVVY